MLDEASTYLQHDGYLIFEIALGQVPEIRELVTQTESFEFLETVVDYGGIERVVVLRKT
jgi:methylase of polypeptide subunit release factors